MERTEQAVAYKHQRNNCCQAVLMAFLDQLDLSEEELRKLGAAFGIGMGNMEGTCGALVAAQMLLGLKRFEKAPIIRDARKMQEAFVGACGASLCKDLKGASTGTVICECDDCIRCAVRLVEAL